MPSCRSPEGSLSSLASLGAALAWAAPFCAGSLLACSTADSATLSLNPDVLTSDEAAAPGQDLPSAATDTPVFAPASCDAGCPEELPFCLNEWCAECDQDAQCDDGELCQLSSGRCREPCREPPDCSLDEFCGASGFCVECEADADCQLTDDPFCSPWGSCVECRADADCATEDEELCLPGVYECDDSF